MKFEFHSACVNVFESGMIVSDLYFETIILVIVHKKPWGSKSLLQDYFNSTGRDESNLSTNDENGHILETIFKVEEPKGCIDGLVWKEEGKVVLRFLSWASVWVGR